MFGKIVGTVIAAGAAALTMKILKDNTDAEFTKSQEIDNVKTATKNTREAAKRTYIAIKDKKEKEEIKEAAMATAKAAGNVVSDAGAIAKTAGMSTVQAAKDIKAKYAEDPEGTKSAIIGNIKEFGTEFTDMVKEKFSPADEAEEETEEKTEESEEKAEESEEKAEEKPETEAKADDCEQADAEEKCCEAAPEAEPCEEKEEEITTAEGDNTEVTEETEESATVSEETI